MNLYSVNFSNDHPVLSTGYSPEAVAERYVREFWTGPSQDVEVHVAQAFLGDSAVGLQWKVIVRANVTLTTYVLSSQELVDQKCCEVA